MRERQIRKRTATRTTRKTRITQYTPSPRIVPGTSPVHQFPQETIFKPKDLHPNPWPASVDIMCPGTPPVHPIAKETLYRSTRKIRSRAPQGASKASRYTPPGTWLYFEKICREFPHGAIYLFIYLF